MAGGAVPLASWLPPIGCGGCAFYISKNGTCARSAVGGSKTEVYRDFAAVVRKDVNRCGPKAVFFVSINAHAATDEPSAGQ